MGLILLELSTKLETTHERLSVFSDVKSKRRLPLALESQKEGDLIMKLTE